MMAFWVVSAVSQGVAAGRAGLWLFAGSVVGIAGRVFWGRAMDRPGRRPLVAAAGLLAAGAAGLLLLSLGHHPVLLGVATVLVFGGGWAWTGLFHLAIIRNYPQTPAAATGFTQLGMRTGGIFGPAGFGLLAEHFSYSVAWMSAAAFMGAGGLLLALARRSLSRAAPLAA